MKKKRMRIFIILSLILSLGSTAPPVIVQAADQNMSRSNKAYQRLKRINHTLSQQLYAKQTDSKKDTDFEWTKFIKNIKYLKNNQLEVYVNDNFKKESEKNRADIIEKVQLFSLRIVDNYRDSNPDDYINGLAAIVFYNGSCIGHSRFLSNKNFIWNK